MKRQTNTENRLILYPSIISFHARNSRFTVSLMLDVICQLLKSRIDGTGIGMPLIIKFMMVIMQLRGIALCIKLQLSRGQDTASAFSLPERPILLPQAGGSTTAFSKNH